MSYKYFTRYLSNNEEVLETFHYNKFFLFLKLYACFLLFLAAFFFMVPIMRLGIYGLVLFFAIILASLTLFFIIYKKWEYNCLVVTNKNILSCYWGFLKNDIEEFSLDSVSNINVEFRSLIAKIFKIGDVIIKLKNNKEVYLDFVFNPKKIKNFILEVRV